MHIFRFSHVSMKATVAFCCALLLSAAFVSCSDSDDENKKESAPEQSDYEVKVSTYDDLSFFQNSIIEVDEQGNIKCQYVGEALYEDEPEHLYVGVDSYEEAETLFREWMAPDVVLGTTAPFTAQLTDAEGKAQGTITFAKGTESGHVAEVTASDETQLKKFKKISFLLNSAWPFNGPKPSHRIGDIIICPLLGFDNSFLKDDDKLLEWVCIREEKNGQNPIFVTITKNDYTYGEILDRTDFRDIQDSKYSPNSARATVVSNILKTNWNYFCSLFDGAKCGSLRKDACWIGQRHMHILFWYDDFMIMSSGTMYGVRSDYWLASKDDKEKKLPFIFVLDWMQDAEVTKIVIPTAGTDIPGHSETYTLLFDNSYDTKWYTQEQFKKDGVWFAEFNTNYAIAFNNYTLFTALDTETYPQRNPVAWTLKGKRLVDDEWTVLDKRDTEKNPSDALPLSNGQSRKYEFTNTKQYRYFRFEISKSKGGTDMQLSGLSLGK